MINLIMETIKGPYQKNRRFYERNMFFQCLTPPYPLIKEQYCENLLMDFEKNLNISNY